MSDNYSDSETSAHEPHDSEAIPESWGGLRIIERLCKGTYSSMFRARDAVLERDIALQLFHTRNEPEKQRLLDEGHTMAGIRHPNIVQVLGADEHDDMVGLKMELIEGQSLRSLLEQQGPADATETIVTGRQLCAALAAIHTAGLPHRPLDLNNVIRDPNGGIRLMGICSDIDEAGVAPELGDGAEPGPLSDIYALGVLLYRFATGDFPPPQDGADVPEQLRDCLDKAVDDDPRLRFATPGKFAKALARAGRRPPSRARRIASIAIILSLTVMVILQWPSQYRLETAMYLLGPGDDRTDLVAGDALDVTDCFALDVSPTVPMFVYVFAEDAQGKVFGLYPRKGSAAKNPLLPETTHDLAATIDGARCWSIASVGEFQRIHILSSAAEIPSFRTQYLAIPQSGPSDAAALPLIESATQLDESADVAIGVTYETLEIPVKVSEP